MANKWKGTPVPKYGAIEKIYLNTKLSTEDVNIELSKLSSSGYDQHYLIYDNSGNKYNSILECSISPYYMRMTYKDPDGNYIDLFTSDEGWKIDYDVIYLNLNEEYYNGQSEELSTPNLISSVISITPFEEEEVIYEGTPVPTEGSLEAVYFNNNMCFEDIMNILNSIPCNISDMPYFVYRSSALTEQNIPEQYVAIFKIDNITTIEMRVRIKEYTQYIMRIFASEYVDGNNYGGSIFGEQLDNYLKHCHKGFSIFNKYIGPDCEGRNSDMGDSYTGSVTMYNNILSPEEVEGAPVGIYNDLLSSLISVTPFKKIVLESKKNEEPSNNESKEFKTPTTIIKNPHFFLKSSGSGGGIIDVEKLPRIKYKGTPLPAVGELLSTVYLNTALTTDEVTEILDQITNMDGEEQTEFFPENGTVYTSWYDVISGTAGDRITIVKRIFDGTTDYQIHYYDKTNMYYPLFVSVKGGWTANSELVMLYADTAHAGQQNNLLNELFSITPFTVDNETVADKSLYRLPNGDIYEYHSIPVDSKKNIGTEVTVGNGESYITVFINTSITNQEMRDIYSMLQYSGLGRDGYVQADLIMNSSVGNICMMFDEESTMLSVQYKQSSSTYHTILEYLFSDDLLRINEEYKGLEYKEFSFNVGSNAIENYNITWCLTSLISKTPFEKLKTNWVVYNKQ